MILGVLGNFCCEYGLIRVAWEKFNACLRSNLWKKRSFLLTFVSIDCFCS